MRKLTLIVLCSVLFLGANPGASLTQRQRANHVLNRLGFGPRPGDVERVMAMGVDSYIRQQLYPERIDDRAVEAKIAKYETLTLSDRELMSEIYQPFIQARRSKKEGERLPREQRPQRVVLELTAAKLDRALDSNRQLNEVMVDFWMNHFNVFAGKGPDRVLISSYERDTIRPRIWGKFEDLLMATAKSPAMLFYLDNARSIATPENRATAGRRTRSGRPGVRASGRPAKQQGGLNENYARELLELHTLGVDGGYTQKDVTELARLLTGWSIARPTENRSGFVFRAALHDSRPKTILGKNFPAGGGLSEGEAMIRYLARHPSTAKHIATKLCQRFVADDPPAALVDRVAKRFLETGGDLRETLKAVITSPEFFEPKYYRVKVKSPFEYVVSAIRAVDGNVTNPLVLAKVLKDMGQPLYFSQPPTGYSDEAEAWVNTGALMNRLNFALGLAAEKLPGIRVRIEGGSVDAIAERLIGGDLTPETRNTIEARLKEQPGPQLAAGLILGSPEFQRQ